MVRELYTSALAWKPPGVFYNSFTRLPPGEFCVVKVRFLIRVHPQAAAAAADDPDPQLQALLADGGGLGVQRVLLPD